jgi:hypothetical protein
LRCEMVRERGVPHNHSRPRSGLRIVPKGSALMGPFYDRPEPVLFSEFIMPLEPLQPRHLP